jgi:alpha-tubulin suppressor-like RCC1 family protein
VVHGTGFTAVRTVLVGTATAHVLQVATHQLTIVIPRRKAGRVDVRVITSAGESTAVKADRFTYVAPPSVSSVAAGVGPAAGGTRVTVKGKGFTHVKAVLFGKTKGTKLHVVSSTRLLITAPAHAAGAVDLRVTTAYGTSKAVKADHFTYGAPTLSGQPIVPTPTPTPAPPTTPAPPKPPAPALVITTASLPGYAAGTSYVGATMAATGGRPPYHWSATGLPLGLTVSTAGVLSGVSHAVAGLRTVQLTVTDSVGTATSRTLPLTVTQPAGLLYAWGVNVNGQTGNGSTSSGVSSSCSPAYAHIGAVVAMAGNAKDTYAVGSDGTVSGIGDDTYGQIFLPTTMTAVTTPTAISGLSKVTSVAVGSLDAFALTSEGNVFAWGDGALGDGHLSGQSTPVQVAPGSDVVSIAASLYDTYAVRADGSVLVWGENLFGELGDGGVDNYALAPQVIPNLTNVTSIVANQYAVFALHRDGTVSAWGANGGGYLGVGSSANTVNAPAAVTGLAGAVQLAAGGSTTYALLQNGTVQAWGYGGSGELGDGATASRTTPGPVSGITNAQAIAATSDTGYAVLADGSAVAWGGNGTCDVGDGTQIERNVPTSLTGLASPLALGSNSLGGTAFGIHRAKIVVKPPLHPVPLSQ